MHPYPVVVGRTPCNLHGVPHVFWDVHEPDELQGSSIVIEKKLLIPLQKLAILYNCFHINQEACDAPIHGSVETGSVRLYI